MSDILRILVKVRLFIMIVGKIWYLLSITPLPPEFAKLAELVIIVLAIFGFYMILSGEAESIDVVLQQGVSW